MAEVNTTVFPDLEWLGQTREVQLQFHFYLRQLTILVAKIREFIKRVNELKRLFRGTPGVL